MAETKLKLTAEISATSQGLIDALRKASGAIDSTSASWKDRFNTLKDSASMIGASLKNLADLTGRIGDVDIDVNGMEQINSSIRNISDSFSTVQGDVDRFTAQLVNLKNQASSLGMPIEDFQRFSEAVKNAEMTETQAITAIQAMKESIMGLANGVPQSVEMFAKLGLTLEQLSSNTVIGNFDAIVQSLQGITSPTEQARASMEFLKVSMQDAVKVSQEYNKLLTTQADNTFASDKDVQGAISLSTAIGKLGEQLAKYTAEADNASKSTVVTNESFAAMFDKLKTQRTLLNDLYVGYSNWVSGLEQSVTSTINASDALNVFWRECQQTLAGVYEMSGSKKVEWLQSLSTDDRQKLQNLLDFVSQAKEKIINEITAVHAIMNQRIAAGSPIDTKELTIAETHLSQLCDAVWGLDDAITMAGVSGVNFSGNAEKDLNDLMKILHQASEVYNDLYSRSYIINNTNDMQNVLSIIRQIDDYSGNLNGVKINVDVEQIDAAKRKLEEFYDSMGTVDFNINGLQIGREEINNMCDRLDDFRKKIVEIQSLADRNWFEKASDGMKKLGNALLEPLPILKNIGNSLIGRISSGIKSLGNAFVHPVDACKNLKRLMDEFVGSANRANDGVRKIGNSTGDVAKQVAGQLLGMGSQVAIIVKGFREIGKIISTAWLDPLRKAGEEMRKFREYLSNGQIDTAKRNYEKYSRMEEDMNKYNDLLEDYMHKQNEVNWDAFFKHKRYIIKEYGLDLQNYLHINDDFFQFAQNGKIDAIKSQIEALQKLNQALEEEYNDRSSYLKNDLFVGTEAKQQGKQRMVEIRREQGSNNDEITRLREQLRIVKSADYFGDWVSARNARDKDISDEAIKKQAEEAKAQQDAKKKAYDEAYKRLLEWDASLTDNDRQKELREILQKYNDAVQAGIDKIDARSVAEYQIHQMLNKESVEEDKKNQELLEALQSRIEQYKDAYMQYRQSQQAVIDAQKDYARTQEDLAKENRQESIERRRSRIQKRLDRYGFTLYDGFKMNESGSSLRSRARVQQLDAQIADKLARQQAGEKVRYTNDERRRIRSYQSLRKKDRQLEAALKQMSAAEKQTRAAEELKNAARAIREAAYNASDAQKNMRQAQQELLAASRNRSTYSVNWLKDKLFDEALKNLQAHGVSGPLGTSAGNYNTQFQQLHRDLQEITRRTYFVK